MAGEPLARRDGGGPEIVELGTVPGFVVFAPGVNGGGSDGHAAGGGRW
jgi:hypothetical protein